MNLNEVPHKVSVEVSEVDLSKLDVGQTVEIVTDKGTFWMVRTFASGFHGQAFGADMVAVWGTDFPAGNPMSTKATRNLHKGKAFEVTNERTEQPYGGTIEHILLLAKPAE